MTAAARWDIWRIAPTARQLTRKMCMEEKGSQKQKNATA
ncbi:hypothetical protein A2U01_0075346 [Trifolium medium]|uniref:Uncharacterized protein n=1 Tax=Trifolium medium TaxID=97028 RepID=A0A392SZF9_9FABA|nr:hypothetical protein [Trifolium medium]